MQEILSVAVELHRYLLLTYGSTLIILTLEATVMFVLITQSVNDNRLTLTSGLKRSIGALLKPKLKRLNAVSESQYHQEKALASHRVNIKMMNELYLLFIYTQLIHFCFLDVK